jgi:multidrug efflux pump subunit AcrB
MWVSELAFKNKPIFYFLLFCILVGGVLSYTQLSKLEDPEIKVMLAQIITVYPGASAHEVELQVTNILEEELSALADIENIKSRSTANVSEVTVELKMTVPQDEIEQRWEFMRRKVEIAESRFPQGVQQPIILDDIGDVYGMFYALTGEGFSYAELEKQAKYIRNNLLEIDGVRKVDTYGEQQPTVEILLSPEKMSEMGIFPTQVMAAIQGQNKMTYSGNLLIKDQILRVAVDDRLSNMEDLENILIQDINGEQFKLSDFADIQKGYVEPIRNSMYLNNKKAIGISLSMESGENIVELGERVEDRMQQLEEAMPVGYEIQKVFFQPDIVNNAMKGFMKNLIASLSVVIIILMVTMGLRSGLIIGSGLLLTILTTFPLLYIVDGSLQRISLGAFIVAMGMLVDNAIVVIDGIIVDMQQFGNKKHVYRNSAKKTALPLLGATIIAVSAFLPVFLSKDTAGTYARDLFTVLCFSLFISWILAITQVPVFSAKFLNNTNRKKQKKDPYSGYLFRAVEKVLSFLMDHKIPTVIVAIVLLALSSYGFRFVKQTFFPDFNYNQAYIEYKLPYGTSPELVNRDLARITNHFLTFDEIKKVVTSQGMTPTRYCLVRPLGEVSDNYGEFIIDFEDYSTMIKMKPILEKYIHDNYPDAYFRIRKYNLSVKSSHLVEVEFTGPDPAVLKKLSLQAEEIMYKNPYCNKYTVCNNWEPTGKALYAKYDRFGASKNSATRSDVSNALLAITDGLPLGSIYEGEIPLKMVFLIRNSDGTRIKDLSDIPVWNILPNINALQKEDLTKLLSGVKEPEQITEKIIRSVPLSAVTKGVDVEQEESVVHRLNYKRSIQAQCDPLDEYSPALLRQSIVDEIEAIELPEGYAMEWMGEFELQSKALYNIFRFFPIALMIIIIVLILLFNDYKRPLIVLVCIPLAIIGIVPGMLLTGKSFTFMAIVGVIGLMGMLIKNSIVLLDEIQKQMVDGKDHYQAVIHATVMRTRPVIMASFTTILGMLPLIFDPMYSSMAVAIISGLLIGTLITLVFVPILYAVLHKIHKQNDVATNAN